MRKAELKDHQTRAKCPRDGKYYHRRVYRDAGNICEATRSSHESLIGEIEFDSVKWIREVFSYHGAVPMQRKRERRIRKQFLM